MLRVITTYLDIHRSPQLVLHATLQLKSLTFQLIRLVDDDVLEGSRVNLLQREVPPAAVLDIALPIQPNADAFSVEGSEVTRLQHPPDEICDTHGVRVHIVVSEVSLASYPRL